MKQVFIIFCALCWIASAWAFEIPDNCNGYEEDSLIVLYCNPTPEQLQANIDRTLSNLHYAETIKDETKRKHEVTITEKQIEILGRLQQLSAPEINVYSSSSSRATQVNTSTPNNISANNTVPANNFASTLTLNNTSTLGNTNTSSSIGTITNNPNGGQGNDSIVVNN